MHLTSIQETSTDTFVHVLRRQLTIELGEVTNLLDNRHHISQCEIDRISTDGNILTASV